MTAVSKLSRPARYVAAEAARNGWNLEDAARRLRYAFFERVCATSQITRIAVAAHTAQDQAETVLAHFDSRDRTYRPRGYLSNCRICNSPTAWH